MIDDKDKICGLNLENSKIVQFLIKNAIVRMKSERINKGRAVIRTINSLHWQENNKKKGIYLWNNSYTR